MQILEMVCAILKDKHRRQFLKMVFLSLLNNKSGKRVLCQRESVPTFSSTCVKHFVERDGV